MLFLEQNFSLPISCSLLAQEVGVSPSHLRSIFKKEYGTSPVRALNEIRIHRAKAMIKSGIFTLQEVAAACGFQNEYYFSRVFKEYVGTSPGKY
jgi:AraC-like DNA-binding protein